MDITAVFEAERERLVHVAARILGDAHEAHDVVQNAWFRMQATEENIRDLPAWLTTVTTRLCLDRLRARIPVPTDVDIQQSAPDPVDEAILADAVSLALYRVLDSLTPAERVAFVLHDSFGFDFPTVAKILGRTPTATRKLASRARGKLSARATAGKVTDEHADAEVVDAFLSAARSGDFARLVLLLAPGVTVVGDPVAVGLGTPARIDGAHEVAHFFHGAAKAALPVFIGADAGAAWFRRGEPRVAFAFVTRAGRVMHVGFRAEPAVLAMIKQRGKHAVA